MASLREIHSRMTSVRSTLKITSAMRLIASAKLHTAQKAVEGAVPYEKALQDVFFSLAAAYPSEFKAVAGPLSAPAEGAESTAVVLVSSNQNLCGSFNANIIKEFAASSFDTSRTDVFAVGKYALKHLKDYAVEDWCSLSGKADYKGASTLCRHLVEAFSQGRVARVVAVYPHFVSATSQTFVTEQILPLVSFDAQAQASAPDYIVEPSPESLLEILLPKMLELKLHTILLDATAAEHAARSTAMQIATENAEELLGELSLTYNKLRQQAITNEILDLVGGQINN